MRTSIEVPAAESTDRTWVRINSSGQMVAVVPNPHYIPTPVVRCDDIQLTLPARKVRK